MRILVVSDTHGDQHLLAKAIQKQRTAEVVIHLGDGVREFELFRAEYPEKTFFCVRGNCDFGVELPHTDTVTLEGKKIFYTHGYAQQVKSGLYTLKQDARSAKADICLFGHTHRAMNEYEDGMYLMNPGSLSRGRASGTLSYGIIDITPGGVFMKILSPTFF